MTVGALRRERFALFQQGTRNMSQGEKFEGLPRGRRVSTYTLMRSHSAGLQTRRRRRVIDDFVARVRWRRRGGPDSLVRSTPKPDGWSSERGPDAGLGSGASAEDSSDDQLGPRIQPERTRAGPRYVARHLFRRGTSLGVPIRHDRLAGMFAAPSPKSSPGTGLIPGAWAMRSRSNGSRW
jgi:hypothetical protein